MIKKIILLTLLLYVPAFGSYDATPVECRVGGIGAGDSTTNMGSNSTWVSSDPINICGSQTITKLELNVRPRADDTATNFKFKLLTLSGTTYTVVHDIDCTAEFELLVKNATEQVLTKTGSWAVTTGTYYFGVYCDNGLDAGTLRYSASEGTFFQKGGDQTSDFEITSTITDAALPFAAYIQTSNRIVYDSSTVTSGRIHIPAFTGNGYHITLEDVNQIKDETSIQMALEYTNASSATTAIGTVLIDFVDTADDISFVGKSRTITVTEANHVNIDIWIDPVNNRGEVVYFNYDNASGAQDSIYDVRALSVTSRSPVSLTDAVIRSINITQPAGSGATIKRLIVHREPVLNISDSFGSRCNTGYTPPRTELANVSKHFDDSTGYFAYPPYAFNAGITGSRVLTAAVGYHTAIKDRWKSETSEWCAIRDCIVIFVNGPGLNDVAALTAASTPTQVATLATDLSSAIAVMARSALDIDDDNGGINDVVLTGQTKYVKYSLDGATWDIDLARYFNHISCQRQFNNQIRALAVTLQIPYFNSWDIDISDTDGTHPTVDGSKAYATGIVNVYENNTIDGGSANTSWLGSYGWFDR